MKFKLCFLFIFALVIGLASTSCEGPVGPIGPQGEQGPPGPVGPAGSDGSIIHAGQGVPDQNTGKPSDFYLDLDTGNLYGPKMAEGWGTPTNLHGPEGPRGPQGPTGPEGPQGPEGPEGPLGPSGEDGNDGADGNDGQDGEDGSQIYAGNGPPGMNLGKKGDYYLDRNNYDLYGPKTNNGWKKPINLQGPKGDQGSEGPAGTTNHSALDNLNADDHMQYLLVDGVRNATDGFTVTGIFGSGTIPIEGEGTRLMWYPGKAAFRAGHVNGTEWDDTNIGEYSSAIGFNTLASGDYSVALGWNANASNDRSTAIGPGTTASGSNSMAMGTNTTASGFRSAAIGSNTIASGDRSTAMGWFTTASGDQSTAMGFSTLAAYPRSLSIGHFNNANSTSDNTLFVVGNGANGANRSDALVLNTVGSMTIAGTLTENSDRRLKTGIHLLEDGVLEKLINISPVRYHFKDSTRHPAGEQLGLIAQEVQKQFPELVNEAGNGTLSLSYSKFTSVLLKGVQEQQVEIERLRSENKAIMERLANLEGHRGVYTTSLSGFKNVNNSASSLWIWIVGGLAFLGLVLRMNRRLPITYFNRNK